MVLAILPKPRRKRNLAPNIQLARGTPMSGAMLDSCTMASLRPLLEAMRAFHYVIGITTPRPEHERRFLLLWIAIVIALLGLGVALVFFLIPRVMQ